MGCEGGTGGFFYLSLEVFCFGDEVLCERMCVSRKLRGEEEVRDGWREGERESDRETSLKRSVKCMRD